MKTLEIDGMKQAFQIDTDDPAYAEKQIVEILKTHGPQGLVDLANDDNVITLNSGQTKSSPVVNKYAQMSNEELGVDQPLSPLAALIQGVGNTASFGYGVPAANKIVSMLGGDPYEQLEERSSRLQSEHPLAHLMGAIGGAFLPGGGVKLMQNLGAKAIPVVAKAPLLARMLQHGGQGLIAGAGYKTVENIPELIDEDTRGEALSDIAGTGGASALLQGLLGPLADKIGVKTRVTPQATKSLSPLAQMERLDPLEVGGKIQTGVSQMKQGGSQAYAALSAPKLESAIGRKTPISKQNFLQSLSGILQDAKVITPKGGLIEGSLKKDTGSYGAGLKKLLYSFYQNKKNMPAQSMNELKQELQGKVSNWATRQGTPQAKATANSVFKKLGASVKTDIEEGISKTQGDKAQRMFSLGSKKYANMKNTAKEIESLVGGKTSGFNQVSKTKIYDKVAANIHDPEAVEILYKSGVNPTVTKSVALDKILKVTPNGYLNVGETANALSKFPDKVIGKIFGKESASIIRLKKVLPELINAGEDKVLMPGNLGKTIFADLSNMSFIGKHNAAAKAISSVLKSVSKLRPEKVLSIPQKMAIMPKNKRENNEN